jgi:hypothetical protein
MWAIPFMLGVFFILSLILYTPAVMWVIAAALSLIPAFIVGMIFGNVVGTVAFLACFAWLCCVIDEVWNEDKRLKESRRKSWHSFDFNDDKGI